jgi:hypothetical protein
MKSQTIVFGRIVKKYTVPLEEIKELNHKYEKAKIHLASFGHRLAGRLESELEFTPILQSTKIYKSMCNCIGDYLKILNQVGLIDDSHKNLDIISCWINDMKEGEYNPPHTHHNLTGWSTVLFLKVPEFINDVTSPHKFKDGQLGFINVDGISTEWIEPKLGDFYIFEARHQHLVMPFKPKKKGEIRRSMSFNFIIKNDDK